MGLGRQHIGRSHSRPHLGSRLCGAQVPDGKPDRQAIDAVTPALREQIEVLDKAVAKTGYLAGDQFTFADINLMPILYYVRMPPEGAEALSRAANLAAYYERHAGRASFVNTTPPAGPPRLPARRAGQRQASE
jgi:glutathione S-transferase